MSTITATGVTMSYGGKKLFEDVNVTFSPGKRYGLTGPNGAGKSTFMKILAGDLEPLTGTVSRPEKTSVLRQDQFAYEDVRVLDVVLMGAKKLWAAMVEKEKILALPEITDELGHRLGELECVVAEEDGYTAEADAGVLLAGLGIPQNALEGPMRELPAGSSCACCSRRRCSASPTRCCSTSRPTTSTSTRSAGSRGSSANIRASWSPFRTTAIS